MRIGGLLDELEPAKGLRRWIQGPMDTWPGKAAIRIRRTIGARECAAY